MRLTAALLTFFADALHNYPESQRSIEQARRLFTGYVPGVHAVDVTATGAAQEVSGLPFDDCFAVLIVNATTAELTVATKTMGAGTALEVAAAAVYAAANGITLNSGLDDEAAIVSRAGSLVLGTAVGAANDVLHLFAVGV